MRWDQYVLLIFVVSISFIFSMLPCLQGRVDCLASAIFSATFNPSSNGCNFCLSNMCQKSQKDSMSLFQDLHSDFTWVWNPFCNPASQVTRFPVEFCALSWPQRKAGMQDIIESWSFTRWLHRTLLPWSLIKTSKGRQGEPTGNPTRAKTSASVYWHCGIYIHLLRQRAWWLIQWATLLCWTIYQR